MSSSCPHVVIADPSESYVLALEGKFLHELRDSIQLEVISDYAYFSEYLKSSVDADVMLVSENLYSDEIMRQAIQKVFILTETQKTGEEPPAGTSYIYKYTNQSTVFNQTMGSYLRQGKRLSSSKGNLLVFYSPIGGSGKTTLAAGVAATLQNVGARVLLLSVEYLQGWGALFPDVLPATSSEAMGLHRENGNPYEAAQALIRHAAVDVLAPMRSNIMSFGLGFGLFTRIADGAKNSGEYDYVIVDTDSALNQEKLELLAKADGIVVSVTDSGSAADKANAFLQSLDVGARERCVLVSNHTNDAGAASQASSAGLPAFGATVPYIPQIREMGAPDLVQVNAIQVLSYLVK